jgi:hypothetical protein
MLQHIAAWIWFAALVPVMALFVLVFVLRVRNQFEATLRILFKEKKPGEYND